MQQTPKQASEAEATQQLMLQAFWENQANMVQLAPADYKTLPIARIKKVMKNEVDFKSLVLASNLDDFCRGTYFVC